MIPAPKMSDVFMDLSAKAEPFLNGRAHQGMAIGARNILEKIQEELEQALEQHPDYAILITGYSLGAGICQLAAMELLQQQKSNVRCISYGAPLVFVKDAEGEDHGNNLFTVVCSHGKLSGGDLKKIEKLFLQMD